MSTLFEFAKDLVWVYCFNLIYRTTHFQRRSQLYYIVNYRSFSFSYRSDAIVVDKNWKIWSFVTLESKLLLVSTICEMRQMYLKKRVGSLLKLFNNKTHKVSKKIQENFTYDNIYYMFISLEFALKNRSCKGYCKYHLFELFCNPCFLFYCYSQLKIKELGVSSNTIIENVALPTILLLSIKLASRVYKPKPIRKVFIPKSDGKMRPLTIPSNIDKIVQKAIFIFLDPIFEKQFLKCSYGFWKNRNCHNCLSHIYYNWTRIKWFIETNFINCFEHISHSILLSLINKKIYNYQISQIIHLLLKVGYINFGASLIDSKLERNVKVFQGSLLSPFFCNILFHELDFFAISLCNKVFYVHYEKELEEWKIQNCYLNIKWKDVLWLIKSKVGKCFFEKKTSSWENLILNETWFCIENKKEWKLTYVRYADAFFFGFIGSKKGAISIFRIVSCFVELSLGMKLDIDKTGVRHPEKGVYFLGYKIWKKHGLNAKRRIINSGYKDWFKSVRLNFSVPIEKLFLCYMQWGFIQKVIKKSVDIFVGRRQDKWLFFSNDAIIVYWFNSILWDIANYYGGSTQQRALFRLYYALRKSVALTIAHWNSKKQALWSMEKYGRDLIIKRNTKNGQEKLIKLFKPKAQKVEWWFLVKGQLNTLLDSSFSVPIFERLNIVCSLEDLLCAIPNCPNNAKEWYYIKHRKWVKGVELQKKISLFVGKKIAVCKKHYWLIENGNYDGPSLKKLRGYVPSNFD